MIEFLFLFLIFAAIMIIISLISYTNRTCGNCVHFIEKKVIVKSVRKGKKTKNKIIPAYCIFHNYSMKENDRSICDAYHEDDFNF